MKYHLIKTFLLTFIISLPSIYSKDKEDVYFSNLPVLIKEGGEYKQQLVAKLKADNEGKITFLHENKIILSSNFKNGDNQFILTLPAVTDREEIEVGVRLNEGATENHSVEMSPVSKKWTVYLVQHSHTDIGYTRPQSEILAEQMRYIDYALDYCDQTDHLPDDAKFRWTCESSWVTREYIRTRPQSQIDRLMKRIEEGRIEVTAMFANMSEIIDENSMIDFLQPMKELKDAGIPISTAMQNDVNGIAWCMPDYFKNSGVKYLIMGINETRSIRPFDIPTCFWWESPSGERLLSFRGEHYMTANFFNIHTDNVDTTRFISILSDLDDRGYPLDRIGIQFSGYFTDNAPPSTIACKFVDDWNRRYEYPKLRMATAGEFMEYVDTNHGDELPVYRNAWLDWWSDGFGSISRETAEIRKTQNQVQSDEGLLSMVALLDGELPQNLQKKIDHIKENIIFYNEHTVGAAESISQPFSENTVRQWLQKGAYAWEAVKQSTLLHEEALARLQPFMKKSSTPLIYVLNPLGWKHSGQVELFIDEEIFPVSGNHTITDIATNEPVPFQLINKRVEGAYWLLDVKDVPPLGFKALKVETDKRSDPLKELQSPGNEVLENSFYKIIVDTNSGAISSLYDKKLNRELLDKTNGYHIGQLVRETSEVRDKAPFIRKTVSNVKIDEIKYGPVFQSIQITSDLDGFRSGTAGSPRGIDCEIRLYNNVKKIELNYTAHKEILTDPEALYVSFPFQLDESQIVFETIGGILSQGEQLPGSSSDWNVLQNFVSVRGTPGQIIVVSNEAPLWQFSDFNMGKFERYPKPGKPWLYSFVMNNYWMTNFRAYQEGAFSWSYQLTSTTDTSNSYATKYARGERNGIASRTFPAGQEKIDTPLLETLELNLPENVLLANIRPSLNGDNSLLLHLREVDGVPARLNVSESKNIDLANSIEVNALGEKIGSLPYPLELKPYEVRFIKVFLK
ncbi:MAG: glycoside hydrolase family 38 C-terminal domain-containing protein [Proteiniphilum sp.]